MFNRCRCFIPMLTNLFCIHSINLFQKNMTDIVQYILLRHDILKDMQWSIGAFVAQACHATVAIIHECADDPITKEYLSDINNMHKVVLAVKNAFNFFY